MTVRTLPDLSALVDAHDAFLVDQFGVLHDGVAAYPGAVEALAALKASGRKVVLLSNSGRRSSANEARLVSLGFRPGSWDLFLTSGEVAWRRFAGDLGEPAVAPGTRCLLIAREGDRSAVDGLGLVLVDRAADADVVLLSGSEGDLHPLDHYRRMLAPLAAAGVPCLCTNPDKVMLTAAGHTFGAGAIADAYAQMGGPVTMIGKPYREIYDVALDWLGGPQRQRVVGVGDSIEHDVAGAKGAGIAAALVRSGILAETPDHGLDALYARYGATPDFVIPAFRWRGEETT